VATVTSAELSPIGIASEQPENPNQIGGMPE
jgi:hypothetical protein